MNRNLHRFAIGTLFFLAGVCFASWASRIPTVQHALNISDSHLGLILFSLPVGLMTSLPLAGWLIGKFGSRNLASVALICYFLFLVCLGFVTSVPMLCLTLFFFGLSSNMVNISVNTQAVGLEQMFERPIMASFHGLWSLAGFTGAFVGSVMVAANIMPKLHFILMAVPAILMVLLVYRFTLKKDEKPEGSKNFAMPDRTLLHLGAITFCGLVCEGAMFDWSGIYFQKIVRPPEEWLGAGYAAVMFTMAGGRFIADRFAHRFGLKRTLQLSGILNATGLMTVVLLPYMIPSIAGFLMVGLGISSVVPLVYSQAGRSKKMSPGVALATVSTIGFGGFLLGPPLIGLISGMTSLRVAFAVVACAGICVTVLSSFIKTAPKA